MRVVFWGTYDKGKPRVRILLQGLRENGVDVVECHREVWGGIEDKSQVRGIAKKLGIVLRWVLAYPVLAWRYLRLPRHDAVVVGYLGQLDVLVLWPLAKLRGVPVVWDAFLSLYNTVVEDRRLLARHNPLAWILRTWERLACRAAHLVVLDTQAHGRYFAETFGIAPRKIKAVFVGAEPAAFSPGTVTARSIEQPPTVLFYGQFIPLHGIDTVVRAAKLTEGDGIRWQIVGTGQEAGRVRDLVQQLAPANLEWIEWIPYTRLIEALRSADVCLGIFGATDKAARVIPNKAFQILMSGRPLITRDSPAIRELLAPEMPGVWLVPPADPGALADAVRDVVAHPMPPELHAALRPQIEPREIARHLLMHMGPLLPNAK